MKKHLQDKAVIDGTQKSSNGGKNAKEQTAATIIANFSGVDTEAAGNTNKTITLMPPPQPPAPPLTVAGDEPGGPKKRRAKNFNLSGLSKGMRDVIKTKRDEANDAIAEKFKNALLDPASTQADIRASLTPIPYSTLKGDIKFNNNGSIRCNTLDKLLKQAFTDAENQMRITLQAEFDARFDAQPIHSEEELQGLDEMHKRIEAPFKNRFPQQDALAA